MTQQSGSDLLQRRKKLLKAKPGSISSDEIVSTIDILLSSIIAESSSDALALLIALCRYLSTTIDSASSSLTTNLLDTIHTTLVPALQPNGSLATLILTSLESSHKPDQLRAADALHAAGRLSTCLPLASTPSSSSSSSTNFVVPLFTSISRGSITLRPALAALSSLIEYVPVSAVPDGLLSRLLDDLELSDSANLRCNLIASILWKRWTDHSSLQLPASEADKDRILFYPLLPYFDPAKNAPSVWTHIIRYLLPACAKLNPSIYHDLLRILDDSSEKSLGALDSHTAFSCWIGVASLAVSTRHVPFRAIPKEKIRDGLSHSDAAVRLQTFQLIAASEDILDPSCVELIKEGFRWNAILPGAGQRTDFASAVHTFLVYFQIESHAAFRAKERIAAGFPAFKEKEMPKMSDGHPLSRGTILANPTQALKTAESLKCWLVGEFALPGMAGAKRYPVVKALLALSVLKLYVDIFGEDQSTQKQVFTRDMVESLLACQRSEYAEVRNRARGLLELARVPLPGYEDINTTASQLLLQSAMQSLNHQRKTQAEAGRASLCILFRKLVQDQTSDLALELGFVRQVVDRLEEHLQAVERDLAGEIEKKPLHGLLAALRDLIDCLDLSSDSAQEQWSSTFHRIFSLVERVWAVTRPVISLAPSQPQTQDGSSAATDRTEHEIARAYEVLGDDEGDDDDAMDHTGLLSGCWRATKEAGELLAVLFSCPLRQAKTSNSIWSRRDVNRAGGCFLTWLHEIRHRGTFSKIAVAFGRLVEAAKTVDHLRDLCQEWLEDEFATIANDHLSTTRRSAALPYSVLAIVSSDKTLLDKAIDVLISLARVSSSTSDVTKVHAFNVLKIVLLDFRQTKLLDQYFERSVLTALEAFESPNWNVRNVGLILFSTLVHRSLSTGKATQNLYSSRTVLSTRQTFAAWHAKFPSILPFITEYLRARQPSSSSTTNTSSNTETNRHSPLFPILIILRSLRHSPNSETLQKQLIPLVEPYLASREWQIRQVAAQALSSLLSPTDALLRIRTKANIPSHDLNAIHGEMCLVERLIADVVEWSEVGEAAKYAIEEKLLVQLRDIDYAEVPILGQKALDCVKAYMENTTPVGDALRRRAGQVAVEAIASQARRTVSLGQSLLLLSSSSIRLHDPSSRGLDTLLNSSHSEAQLAALQCLEAGRKAETTQSTFASVVSLALSEHQDVYVRVAALDAVSSIAWSSEALSGSSDPKRLDFCKKVEEIMRTTKCVPLKQAALPALGWGLSLASEEGSPDEAIFDRLARYLLQACHEDESEPSRSSALKCLSHLSPWLFASIDQGHPKSTLRFHQTLLRLLQDDDDDIRLGAAEIVRSGRGVQQGISQQKALEIWWEWLREVLPVWEDEERRRWMEWLVKIIRDLANASMPSTSTVSRSDILFEIEPSNLYRDPLIDAQYAVAILISLTGTGLRVPENQVAERREWKREMEKSLERANESGISPIDDIWEVNRVAATILGLLDSVLA